MSIEILTKDDLKETIAALEKKIDKLNQGIITQTWLNVPELSKYIKLSQSHIYTLLQKRAIPATKKTGNWLFRKSDIDRWLNEYV
mgnify:CR=1 FL=1